MCGFKCNFWHGNNHLCDLFGLLAMLALQVVRSSGAAAGRSKGAPAPAEPVSAGWPAGSGRRFAFPGWETLYRDLAGELGREDHIGLIPATDRGRGGAPRASTAPIQRQPSPNLEKSHRGRSPGHCPCAPETLKPRKAAKKFIGGNYCISTDQLVTGYLLNVTGK